MMECQEDKKALVVDARDIQQRIENGEDIIITGKTISGSLNLNTYKIPKIFEGYAELKPEFGHQCKQLGRKANFITSRINIINCSIDNNMDFKNSIFYNSVNFENCVFKKDVSFRCSRFIGPADFNRAKFLENADFSNSSFRGSVRFDRVNFRKGAKFDSVAFIAGAYNTLGDKSIIFYGSKFESLANFENAEFGEYADFGISKFISGVLFRKTRFNQNANFDNAMIYEHAIFEGAAFGRTLYNIAEGASFKGTLFRGNINFRESKFYNGATFERTKFEGDAIFIGAIFCDHMILTSAKIGRMHLRGINFGQEYFGHKPLIILDDAEFEKLLIRWDLIKDHLDQDIFNPALNDDAVYLQLIKGFKEQGLFEDADRCYLELRNKKKLNFFKLKNINDFKYWLNDSISWHLYGHGVNYLMPLYTSIKIIFISFISYFIIYAINGAEYPKNLQYGNQTYSLVIRSLYSCLVSFISNPQVDGDLISITNWIGILERLLGIILVSTFLVALAKKTIR